MLLSVLAVALLLSAAAYATADVSAPIVGTLNGSGKLEASGPVSVKAKVNPKLTLTITTPDASQTVDFGAVDPGTATGGKSVGLSVNSNKDFTVASAVTGQSAEIGLATAGLGTSGTAGQNRTFTDNYSINVPWATAPGDYLATVTYTVTQN